jgi:hypothetical protein
VLLYQTEVCNAIAINVQASAARSLLRTVAKPAAAAASGEAQLVGVRPFAGWIGADRTADLDCAASCSLVTRKPGCSTERQAAVEVGEYGTSFCRLVALNERLVALESRTTSKGRI